MRIIDIIRANTPCRLEHPIIGKVYWGIAEGNTWGLCFAEGPEKGHYLAADSSVLLDDNWICTNKIDSYTLAGLIADALVPKFIKKEDFNLVAEIVEEEINARKAMGDY